MTEASAPWPLLAQDQVWRYFAALVREDRVPSSFLFVGPPGVGKWTAARELARALLCQGRPQRQLKSCGVCHSCTLLEAGTHPDWFAVAPPEGKTQIPLEAIAGARDQRGQQGLIYHLGLRPALGRFKVAVVDEADGLTPEAANSLLKTLEEPPPGSVLILISHNPDKQLSTIRSRCQQVNFRPLPTEVVERLLLQLGWVHQTEQARRIARFAQGSMRQASLLLDEFLWELRKQVMEELTQRRPRPFALTQLVEQALEGFKQPAQRRQVAEALLGMVLGFYHAMLRHRIGAEVEADDHLAQWLHQADPRAWHPEALQVCVARVVQAQELLGRNVQVGLVLQSLWHDLARQHAQLHRPQYQLQSVFHRGVSTVETG